MLFRDKRGNMSFMLMGLVVIVILLTTLIGEYIRINALIDRVEAQLIQAANVSLESTMMDSYRIDHRGGINVEDARESLRVFFTQTIGLTNGNQLLGPGGDVIYSLNDVQINITEDPPLIEIRCTLEFPSILTLFDNFSIPIQIRSRNVRLW